MSWGEKHMIGDRFVLEYGNIIRVNGQEIIRAGQVVTISGYCGLDSYTLKEAPSGRFGMYGGIWKKLPRQRQTPVIDKQYEDLFV